MQNALTLEPYRPDLADELVAMWRASFEHGVGVAHLHTLDEQRRWFDEHLSVETDVHVALHDGHLVGFSATTPESVAQLYVRVGHHGQGIGTRLLELAKQGSSGSLWLYAFTRNANACRFYERRGFHLVAHGFEPEWRLEDVKYLWTRPA